MTAAEGRRTAILRNSCGTFLGSLLHGALGEPGCPARGEAEALRRAEQARRNPAVLTEAVREHGRLRRAA